MIYQEIPSALRNRQPFDGNSMSARRTLDGYYTVYSYATIIAEVDPQGAVTFDDRKYSQTTSRHQSLCHANL